MAEAQLAVDRTKPVDPNVLFDFVSSAEYRIQSFRIRDDDVKSFSIGECPERYGSRRNTRSVASCHIWRVSREIVAKMLRRLVWW